MIRLLFLLALWALPAAAQEAIIGSDIIGTSGSALCGIGSNPACMKAPMFNVGTPTNALSTTVTQYTPLVVGQYLSAWTSTAQIGTPMPVAGTISNVQCALQTTNSVASSSYTFTLYKGSAGTFPGTATAIVCSLPQGTQITTDTTHTVTFNAGDFFYWQSVPAGTPTAETVSITALFTDQSLIGNEAPLCYSTSQNAETFGNFYSPGSGVSTQTSDTLASLQFPAAGTIDDLYIVRNSAAGSASYTVYHNGSPTSLVATTSSAKNASDTTAGHAITIAVGDTLSITPANVSGATANVHAACVRWRPTTAGQYVEASTVTTGFPVGTRYGTPVGGISTGGLASTGTGGLATSFAYTAGGCSSQCMTIKNLQVTTASAPTQTLTVNMVDRTFGGSDTAVTAFQVAQTGTNGGVNSGGSPTNCSCSATIKSASASTSNINTADFFQFKAVLATSGVVSQTKLSYVITVP